MMWKRYLYFRKPVHCITALGDELRSGASPGTLSKGKACQNSEGVAAMHTHIHTHAHTHIHLMSSHLISSHRLYTFVLSLRSPVEMYACYRVIVHWNAIMAAQAPTRGLAPNSSQLMQQIYSSLISHRVEDSSTPTPKKMLHWIY